MREKGESLKVSCEILGTSRSSHYRKMGSRKRTSSLNETLVERIKELRLAHPFWGYRRMTAWLRLREGYSVNHKRIQKLMRENGLSVDQTRHKTLRKSQRAKPKATRPRQYRGTDMTKFLLGSLGWCYPIIVVDWFTKEIVGWHLSLRARTLEWKEALERGLFEHFPWGVREQGLNLVSDNGSQPTSVSFMRDIALLGVNQIFCSYDNPRGNAETERVIQTIEEELLWLNENEFTSFEQAYEAIESWINNDYNRLYVHSALGYRSPLEYRQQWEQHQSQVTVFGGC